MSNRTTASGAASPEQTAARRWVLFAIAVASALPRLILGKSQYVEYDGYWHVFIAQQDDWARFWHDIYVNAHPPLYFLLLKAVLHLGHSLLVYRAISIVSGVLAVYVAGLIAFRITQSNIRACQCALAFGFAMASIIVSNEVRSYMLSALFVLLSFHQFLALLNSSGRSAVAARAGYAVWAIFACLSHYYAFFYCGATMLLLSGMYLWGVWRRELPDRFRAGAADLATMAPIAATILILYRTHAGLLAQVQNHLLPYYLARAGSETVAAFLMRNWQNLLNLFLPFDVSRAGAFAGLIVLVAGTLAVWFVPFYRGNRSLAIAAVTTTNVLLAAIAFSGVADKYPFGGDLRQQYLLFPFLVFDAVVFLDYAGLGRLRSPLARRSIDAAIVAAIVLISVIRFQQFPRVDSKILADRMAVFNQLIPNPKAVYVDQFNLITFFSFHDDWHWSSVRLPRSVPGIEVYELRRGKDEMLVFRDTQEWDVDADQAGIYDKLSACIQAAGGRDVSVFAVRQTDVKQALPYPEMVARSVPHTAAKAGICPARLDVTSSGWYGEFGNKSCPPAERPSTEERASELSPPPGGRIDDATPNFQYVGQWTHSHLPRAAGQTLSLSKDPGALARVRFTGTAVTWVYTKGSDRGIGEIRVDGKVLDEADLYAPDIKWQARMTFRNLTPGMHELEIGVTGRKNAAAADRYVDVDEIRVDESRR